jgi:hypothetical protein
MFPSYSQRIDRKEATVIKNNELITETDPGVGTEVEGKRMQTGITANLGVGGHGVLALDLDRHLAEAIGTIEADQEVRIATTEAIAVMIGGAAGPRLMARVRDKGSPRPTEMTPSETTTHLRARKSFCRNRASNRLLRLSLSRRRGSRCRGC